MEHKKVKVSFENGALKLGLDLDQDGKNFLDMEVSFSEAIAEIFSRGGAVPGAKLVELKFEDGKLKMLIDTDRDGEKLMSLSLDFSESIKEITGLFRKE